MAAVFLIFIKVIQFGSVANFPKLKNLPFAKFAKFAGRSGQWGDKPAEMIGGTYICDKDDYLISCSNIKMRISIGPDFR